MQNLDDPGHPVWSFARFLVISTVATVALWLNASNFDETEIRSLITLIVTLTGVETVGQYFRKRK